MTTGIIAVPVQTMTDEGSDSRLDLVAVEEPLEIRVNGHSVGITMRTPGDDQDLARGLLYNEKVIDDASEIASMEYAKEKRNPRQANNTLMVQLRAGFDPNLDHMQRSSFANSSCGICGRLSIDSIEPQIRALLGEGPVFAGSLIHQLPERLRKNQTGFNQTGGLHAAALFHSGGEFLGSREDVGRHNAVDKIVGAALLHPVEMRTQSILFVSGRAGFELVQKAVTAGIPVMAAVGAPSSLAVETAHRFGLTLIGFVRGNRFNVYTGGWRIQ